MNSSGPLNSAYVELLGASRLEKATVAGFLYGNKIEMMMDFMVTNFGSGAQANLAIGGDYLNPAWFEMDAPATNTAITAPVRFGVLRGAVDKYSGDGTITLGRRHVLYGVDDQSNVYGWLDDAALGAATSQAAWTAAQAAINITSPGPIYFGYDSSVSRYTRIRIYEAWVKLNGAVVLHVTPRIGETTTITDRSDFGNDLTVTGTAGTDSLLRSSWNKSRAFGSEAAA